MWGQCLSIIICIIIDIRKTYSPGKREEGSSFLLFLNFFCEIRSCFEKNFDFADQIFLLWLCSDRDAEQA